MASRLSIAFLAATVALFGAEVWAQTLKKPGTPIRAKSPLPANLMKSLKIKPLSARQKSRIARMRSELNKRSRGKPNSRFNSKTKTGRLIGSNPAKLREPFELSAANPFIRRRGWFTFFGGGFDPTYWGFYIRDGIRGHLAVHLTSLTPGKMVVVECQISSQGTLHMGDENSEVQVVYPERASASKLVAFAFRAVGRGNTVWITNPANRLIWVNSCRITPER